MELLFPSQKTTMAEKKKANWYIPCCDYLIDRCIIMNNKIEVRRNMDAANGIIDQKTYDYVLHPLTQYDDSLHNLPGEIRDVDFITPIREKQIGEYIQLPYAFHVKTNDVDVVLERSEKYRKELTKLMQQAFINYANQHEDTGVDSKPVPDISEFSKNFMQNYIDEKAIKGQERLNLLNDITDFETKRIQAFYYWWACEEFYTHRWIENGEVRTEVISPLDGFPLDNGEQFVEDMDGFVWRRRITFSQFIDDYRDKVRDEDFEIVEDLFRRYNNSEPLQFPVQMFERRYQNDSLLNYYNTYSNYFGVRSDNPYSNFASPQFLLDCYKVCWKTLVPVKLLTYVNEFDKELEIEVPMEYKLDKEHGDKHVRTEWINTLMTMFRFGNRYCGVYTEPKEEVVVRRDIANPSKIKLPFGGKRGLLWGVFMNPVPKRILPYLALFRIYNLQIERNIAKYHGNIEIIPQALLNPDDTGTTKDKIYYMTADNRLFYDDEKVDINKVAQGVRVIGNDGLSDYLKTLYSIREGIKKDAWELAHMNDERMGNADTQGGKGNNEANTAKAKIGSTLMIKMFHEALRRDHIADLEFTKVAWINGKTGSYWDSNKNNYQYVTIDEAEGLDTYFGVFVKNSIDEDIKLQEFKKLAFNAAQNGDSELAAEAISADNVPQLMKYIKQHVEAEKKFKEQQAQQEQATQKYVADSAKATADADRASTEKIAANREAHADYRAELAIPEVLDQSNKTGIESNIDSNLKERKLDLEQQNIDINRNKNIHDRAHKRAMLHNSMVKKG